MTLLEWKNKGSLVDVNGVKLFTVQHINGSAPVLAFLHGYPSASYDYHHILPAVELAGFSYVLHDHLGFGLSGKPADASYSLLDQAQRAMQLWQQLGLTAVHIVSHDYGTTVANEIVVQKLNGNEPVKIKSVTFCNGSMHIELAHLKLVQKLLKHPLFGKIIVRLMNKSTFMRTMRDIWHDKSKFDKNEMDVLWEMLMSDITPDVLHRVSQYNNERIKYWDRWIPPLQQIDFPVHILWAQQDPIAVKAIAETLHKEIPNSVYTKIDNCGHYPMLEKPGEWSEKMLRYIRAL